MTMLTVVFWSVTNADTTQEKGYVEGKTSGISFTTAELSDRYGTLFVLYCIDGGYMSDHFGYGVTLFLARRWK